VLGDVPGGGRVVMIAVLAPIAPASLWSSIPRERVRK
jgi:hypothetical protein